MAKPRCGPRQCSTDLNSAPRHVRCAIYTRKSTEEGLEQQFNSLDAQREACAAYIESQKHEGWSLLPERFDDGGFSGGTMDRPALKRLLLSVSAGEIDVIVVYKIDRLTRALFDFSRIVETLASKDASFVSVTQAFNTTTSMGRLTLNVLLSFAQFERELTGERIRDKIAASKRKGMWMGGPIPLGYDLSNRRLIVNDAEARTVRLIFERHHAVRSLNALAADLAARGVRSKIRRTRAGKLSGGGPYKAGALAYLLRNILYTGRISHRAEIYEGVHKAIIDRALWDQSQALLDLSAGRPRTGHVSLLTGIVEDIHGRPMGSAHAIKGPRRYRYYVSSIAGQRTDQICRIPAGDLEAIVGRAVKDLVGDPYRVSREIAVTPNTSFSSRCLELIGELKDSAALRNLLVQLGVKVIVRTQAIMIGIDRRALCLIFREYNEVVIQEPVSLSVPIELRRRGHEIRLVQSGSDIKPDRRDERLVQLLSKGYAAYSELLKTSDVISTTRRSHLTRLARLRFLDPAIVTAIIEGRQPVELTSRALLRSAELPSIWSDQRRMLGFE